MTAPTSGVECHTTGPVVATTTSANASTVNTPTTTIAGTSDLLNSSVAVSVDGGTPVTATTNSAGAWTTTSPTLAEGAHGISVTGIDAASTSSTVTSTFAVDLLPDGGHHRPGRRLEHQRLDPHRHRNDHPQHRRGRGLPRRRADHDGHGRRRRGVDHHPRQPAR